MFNAVRSPFMGSPISIQSENQSVLYSTSAQDIVASFDREYTHIPGIQGYLHAACDDVWKHVEAPCTVEPFLPKASQCNFLHKDAFHPSETTILHLKGLIFGCNFCCLAFCWVHSGIPISPAYQAIRFERVFLPSSLSCSHAELEAL